jgi:hypothetical protein
VLQWIKGTRAKDMTFPKCKAKQTRLPPHDTRPLFWECTHDHRVLQGITLHTHKPLFFVQWQCTITPKLFCSMMITACLMGSSRIRHLDRKKERNVMHGIFWPQLALADAPEEDPVLSCWRFSSVVVVVTVISYLLYCSTQVGRWSFAGIRKLHLSPSLCKT